jgi:sugar lactone lactonase YvrE
MSDTTPPPTDPAPRGMPRDTVPVPPEIAPVLQAPWRAVSVAPARLGEAPHWDPRTGCLWWVDIAMHRVHRLDAQGDERSWAVPDSVSAAVPVRDGPQLLLALGAGLAWFDPDSGHVDPWLALAGPGAGLRTNDTRCDARGRCWVSLMQNNLGPEGEEMPLTADIGALFRVDRGRRAEALLTGLGIPNTLAWSTDGRTLFHADSRAGALFAYPLDAHGTPSGGKRRLLAGGVPDGSATDHDGQLWNARWGDGEILRLDVSAGGPARATLRLPVPARQPTSCCFGGPRGDRLYVTSARIGLAHPGELEGHVFEFDLSATGLAGPPLHPFGPAPAPNDETP